MQLATLASARDGDKGEKLWAHSTVWNQIEIPFLHWNHITLHSYLQSSYLSLRYTLSTRSDHLSVLTSTKLWDMALMELLRNPVLWNHSSSTQALSWSTDIQRTLNYSTTSTGPEQLFQHLFFRFPKQTVHVTIIDFPLNAHPKLRLTMLIHELIAQQWTT